MTIFSSDSTERALARCISASSVSVARLRFSVIVSIESVMALSAVVMLARELAESRLFMSLPLSTTSCIAVLTPPTASSTSASMRVSKLSCMRLLFSIVASVCSSSVCRI